MHLARSFLSPPFLTVTHSGVGAAHSLHSVAGILGPIVAGAFVDVDVDVTLVSFISLVILSAICAICLPNETRGKELQDFTADGNEVRVVSLCDTLLEKGEGQR